MEKIGKIRNNLEKIEKQLETIGKILEKFGEKMKIHKKYSTISCVSIFMDVCFLGINFTIIQVSLSLLL